LGILLTNIGVSAFWQDETATISASTRTLSQLLVLVKHVDAVHGFFYLMMHFWLQIFGVSQFSLRLPGTIALAIAATLLFLLLRKRTNWQSATLATLVFVLLPRVVWASSIGRSYALTVLVALTLTWVLLRIVELPQPRWVWFVGYALLAIVGCWLFLYLALLVVAHAVSILIIRPSRKKVWHFVIAAAAALVAASPIALFAGREIHQIAWLPAVNKDILANLFGGAYFLDVAWISWPAWLIVLFGLIRLASLFASNRTQVTSVANLAIIALVSCLLPLLIVFSYSLGRKSIFDARYFTYSAPMFAVLLGLAFWLVRPKWVSVGLALLLVAVSVPKDLSMRQPDSFGNDFDKVAIAIQNEAHVGDAVIFAPLVENSGAASRAWISYRSAYSKVSVLGFKNDLNKQGSLLDHPRSKTETIKQAANFSRVWFVKSKAGNSAFAYIEGLQALGFKATKVENLEYEVITLYLR
jgi:mannosyltransferase